MATAGEARGEQIDDKSAPLLLPVLRTRPTRRARLARRPRRDGTARSIPRRRRLRGRAAGANSPTTAGAAATAATATITITTTAAAAAAPCSSPLTVHALHR